MQQKFSRLRLKIFGKQGKIRGKGVPLARGYGRGDLLVEIKVLTPRHLSKKAREIIEKLKEEEI